MCSCVGALAAPGLADYRPPKMGSMRSYSVPVWAYGVVVCAHVSR